MERGLCAGKCVYRKILDSSFVFNFSCQGSADRQDSGATEEKEKNAQVQLEKAKVHYISYNPGHNKCLNCLY